MKLLFLVLVATLLGAATLKGTGASRAEMPAEPALTEREQMRGRLLFMQCRACHAVTGDEGARIGPSLVGIFGQPAASVEGYDQYSDQLRSAQLVWDDATMDEWIRSPATKVPGNLMAYGGMSSEADRQLLVRYLRKITAPAAD